MKRTFEVLVGFTLTIVIFFAGYGAGTYNTQAPTSEVNSVQVSPSPEIYSVDELLIAINEHRLKVGLKSFGTSLEMFNLAEYSAQYSCGEIISHDGLRKIQEENKIKTAFGEVVAKGYTPKQTVREWVKSPTHKEIIESPDYTEIGVAVVGDCHLALVR